jgi:hypothetical protein
MTPPDGDFQMNWPPGGIGSDENGMWKKVIVCVVFVRLVQVIATLSFAYRYFGQMAVG